MPNDVGGCHAVSCSIARCGVDLRHGLCCRRMALPKPEADARIQDLRRSRKAEQEGEVVIYATNPEQAELKVLAPAQRNVSEDHADLPAPSGWRPDGQGAVGTAGADLSHRCNASLRTPMRGGCFSTGCCRRSTRRRLATISTFTRPAPTRRRPRADCRSTNCGCCCRRTGTPFCRAVPNSPVNGTG